MYLISHNVEHFVNSPFREKLLVSVFLYFVETPFCVRREYGSCTSPKNLLQLIRIYQCYVVKRCLVKATVDTLAVLYYRLLL